MAFNFGLRYQASSTSATATQSTGQQLSGSGVPGGTVPQDQSQAASYYDETNGINYAWSTTAQEWQPLTELVEYLPVTTNGQISFTLSRAPSFPAQSDVDLNGVEQTYDAGGSGDYHFTGTALIYDGPLNLTTDYQFKVTYR